MVLESKGLADVVEWFVRHELDGHAFLELSVAQMQARVTNPWPDRVPMFCSQRRGIRCRVMVRIWSSSLS